MNKKKTKSFTGQLRKAFIMIILIPVLCLGGFMFYSLFDYMEDKMVAESNNIVEQNQADISTRIEMCDTSLRYLAANYNLQDFLLMNNLDYLELSRTSKNIGELFYNVLNTNPYFKSLTLYTDKEIYTLTDFVRHTDEAESESWYEGLMETGENYWWNEDGKLFVGKKIVAAYPNRVIGIIKMEVRRELFTDSFSIFQEMPIQISIQDERGKFYTYEDASYSGNVKYVKYAGLSVDGWRICYRIDQEYYEAYALINLLPSIAILLLVLILTWGMIHYFSRRLSRDLSVLLREVEEAQNGNLDVEIQESDITEIQTLADSIATFLNRIKMLIREVYDKEIERQDLELNLLQSKISPHFLYNNLSAINWLALDCGQEKISRITTELAAFYRTALNKGKNVDKIEVELANIKAYLNLQLIAHEESFDVTCEVEKELEHLDIPIFILQPLVENSIEHGIDQLRNKKGRIEIGIRKEGEWLLMRVHDNGTELYGRIGESVMSPDEYGYGTGNVNKRIQLLYGTESGLVIYADGSGTTAEIRIKYQALKHTLSV